MQDADYLRYSMGCRSSPNTIILRSDCSLMEEQRKEYYLIQPEA